MGTGNPILIEARRGEKDTLAFVVIEREISPGVWKQTRFFEPDSYEQLQNYSNDGSEEFRVVSRFRSTCCSDVGR